jgi:hypothetical protein
MIRRISSMTVGVAVSLAASGALAQEASAEATAAVPAPAAGAGFGHSGQLAIGVERLFGFVSSSTKEEPDVANPTTTTRRSTEFSLIGRFPVSAYQFPRLGVDYFLADSISVGGSLVFSRISNEQESENAAGSGTLDLPTVTTFLIAPRAGYALIFSDMLGIWPKAGLTFFTTSASVDIIDPATGAKAGERTTSANGLSLSVEVPLVISPVDHLAFTVGPALDFPLTGSGSDERTSPPATTTDSTIKTTDIAVNAGLLTWF